jgi:hypothetical protein
MHGRTRNIRNRKKTENINNLRRAAFSRNSGNRMRV